jgi:rubrerythrin
MNAELNKVMKEALDFEKKGHDIYEDTAKSTKNPLVAKTFTYLAEQESLHITEIQDYIKSRKIEFLGDRQEATQRFFATTVSEFKMRTKLSETDIKVHEIALELEKRAYHFYLEQFRKANDPELKQFFEFLMKQEKTHYEFVKRAYEYIQDPVAFYQKSEDALFEGW